MELKLSKTYCFLGTTLSKPIFCRSLLELLLDRFCESQEKQSANTQAHSDTLTLVFSDSISTMGRMAVERHGDWVRSLEMFNVVSLVLLNKRCTSADDRRLSCWGRVGLWEVS